MHEPTGHSYDRGDGGEVIGGDGGDVIGGDARMGGFLFPTLAFVALVPLLGAVSPVRVSLPPLVPTCPPPADCPDPPTPQEGLVLAVAAAAAAAALALAAAWAWARSRFPRPARGTVGFFHPYADGGGGGERVLWCALAALQAARPRLRLVVYTGGAAAEGDADAAPAALAAHALDVFNVAVAPTFRVVPLPRRALLDPAAHPRATMAGQAAASVRLAADALAAVTPELWVDTTGWAFPYPLVRLAGARVAAYVHYPTVSPEVVARAWRAAGPAGRGRGGGEEDDGGGEGEREREGGGGPVAAAAAPRRGRGAALARAAYLSAVAAAYGAAGAAASAVAANSSWTRRRVAAAWWRAAPPALVYPPVGVAALASLPLDRRLKRLYVVSVAQFRPEKEHELQLRAFARALRLVGAGAAASARLVLVGGVRGPADEARVAALRRLAARLGVADAVEVRANLPFSGLRALLAEAAVGLHAMREEHFGIAVCEYMAAGVPPVAHASGGPAEDLVRPDPDTGERTGWLADGEAAYAAALAEALTLPQAERLRVAAAARRRALGFSDERFAAEWLVWIAPVLPRDPPR